MYITYDQGMYIPKFLLVRAHLAMTEQCLLGKVLRRMQFSLRYCRAVLRWHELKKLEPIVREHFKLELKEGEKQWISHVQARLRALQGFEDAVLRVLWKGDMHWFMLRYFPWRLQNCFCHWGAPITVLVAIDGKKTGPYTLIPKAVRYMSMSVKRRTLTVCQLQGVQGVQMKDGLGNWQKRFLSAVVEFATKMNYETVRIPEAASLYSFYHPFIDPTLSDKARENAISAIQQSMILCHDTIPDELEWKKVGQTRVWYNPQYEPLTWGQRLTMLIERCRAIVRKRPLPEEG
jgi:hypothetical protein